MSKEREGPGASEGESSSVSGRAMILVVTVTIAFAGYLAVRRIAGHGESNGAAEAAIAGATLRTDEGLSIAIAPFHLDETEVTVRAYRACVEAHACTEAGTSEGCNASTPMSDAHPIDCVDHVQADAFCRWAGRRLPTEDELELAARGPSRRTYPWGEDAPDASRANFADRSLVEWRKQLGKAEPPTLLPTSDGWPNSATVGAFAGGRTPEGIVDLAGNVREWTSTPWCPRRGDACEPKSFVVRGGGFLTARVEETRSGFREGVDATARAEDLGFRCAR
jgi:formylglycine-generating enzyme required for sulfatase activity